MTTDRFGDLNVTPLKQMGKVTRTSIGVDDARKTNAYTRTLDRGKCAFRMARLTSTSIA